MSVTAWTRRAGGALVAALMATHGADLAGVAKVNAGLLAYVRDALARPVVSSWAPEDALLARLEGAAGHSPSVGRQPHLALFAIIRSGASRPFGAMCFGEPDAFLLVLVLNRGRQFAATGDQAAAEELYAWADQSCPDSFDVLAEWAQLKKTDGDHRRAIALLTRAARTLPSIVPSDHVDKTADWWRRSRQTELYSDLGDLYLNVNAPAEAILALERARDLAPHEVSRWLLQLLGIAYYREGRISEARAAFVAALDRDHTRRDPTLSDARGYLQKIDSGGR